MRKTTALLLLIFTLFLSSCSPSIERGTWEDGVYYNHYGNFKIVTNPYYDIYTDKQIKQNMKFVKKGNMLNDMVISSDFAAIIVTIERSQTDYTQEEYVNLYVENTKNESIPGSYSIAKTYTEKIANQNFTCVPVMYKNGSGDKAVSYFEFDYILKAEQYFIIIRITAGNQNDARIPLGMIKPII